MAYPIKSAMSSSSLGVYINLSLQLTAISGTGPIRTAQYASKALIGQPAFTVWCLWPLPAGPAYYYKHRPARPAPPTSHYYTYYSKSPCPASRHPAPSPPPVPPPSHHSTTLSALQKTCPALSANPVPASPALPSQPAPPRPAALLLSHGSLVITGTNSNSTKKKDIYRKKKINDFTMILQ